MKKHLLKSIYTIAGVLLAGTFFGQPIFPTISSNPALPVFQANDVTYLNKDTAVAVGNNGMSWRSIDGGLNWTAISTFTSTTDNNSVIMMGKYICVAGDQGTVTFSNDKGVTWQNTVQAQPAIDYRGVHFADTTFGASVGDNGDAVIYHWVGGLGWAHIPSTQTDTFKAVSSWKTSTSVFVDGNAMAVGHNGAVSTYAFGSWTNLTPPTTRNLNGIYIFPTHDTVIVVGDGGLIMKSPDYGANWVTINSVGNNLNDISEGLNPNQFIAVGDSGAIWVSNDRGNSFVEFTIGFGNTNLKGVSAKDPKGSFAGSGNVLRLMATDTVKITYMSDSVLCPGENFKVAIDLRGIFGGNNLVSVELSDAAGSFALPTVIGSKLNPLMIDTISCSIPMNATAASLYQLRASSNDPVLTGDVNPITVTVNSKPNNVNATVINGTDIYVNSQSGCTYQWFFNGNPMSGETDTIVTTIGNGNYNVVVTGSNGCWNISNIVNYNAIGIKNISAMQISVSPNPATNVVNIFVPGTTGKNLLIYNALGKKVGAEKLKAGTNHINCEEFEAGIYFLQVDNYTKKLVLVK